jgi:hypothetical protein
MRTCWRSPAEILEAAASSYHEDRWGLQEARVVVVLEKAALAGPTNAPIPSRGPRMLDSSRAQQYSTFMNLPVMLAGPLVRRVELNLVSVWVALKEAASNVKLSSLPHRRSPSAWLPLGTDGAPDPEKPKRMRWTTFNAALNRIEHWEGGQRTFRSHDSAAPTGAS